MVDCGRADEVLSRVFGRRGLAAHFANTLQYAAAVRIADLSAEIAEVWR